MLNYRYNLKALIDELEKNNELDVFIGDIFRFNLTCDESYGIKEVLFDEHVAADSKIAHFKKVFSGVLSESFRAFVLQLIENNDLHFYKVISEKFVDLIDQEKNSSFVEVVSAVSMSQDQQNAVKAELERVIQSNVYMFNTVSKNVLGGFIIKSGEKMLDFSVQSGLDKLKTTLLR